jgi:hypothetical protein
MEQKQSQPEGTLGFLLRMQGSFDKSMSRPILGGFDNSMSQHTLGGFDNTMSLS